MYPAVRAGNTVSTVSKRIVNDSVRYSISRDNTCQYAMNTSNTMYLDILARQWSRDGACLPQLLLGPGYIPQGVLGVVLGAAKATHR